MFRRFPLVALAAAATASTLAIAACSSSSSTSSGSTTAQGGGSSSGMPTVTMMVGGIDKQIYLPYQLAQSLGFYKKYGVNMVLSTEHPLVDVPVAPDHRARVIGQALNACLDHHARVEARTEGRWRFTHGRFGSR